MGKFDGVLLISDYDATFAVGSQVPPENLELLAYFKAQGGLFTVATGRARHTFRTIRPLIPFNAPVLLANGAVIYDFEKEETLFSCPLPPSVVQDMAILAKDRPEMSFEAYAGENDIYAWNPNDYVRYHLAHTGTRSHLCPIEEMPFPWHKAILENDHQTLLDFQAEILRRWGDRYEVIFSSENMLELNAKGCTKANSARRLASLLGVRPENLYCVGDNENDIPMLKISAIPFAPANAIPEVKALPGLVLLPRCEEGAVAALIRRLDAIY